MRRIIIFMAAEGKILKNFSVYEPGNDKSK